MLKLVASLYMVIHVKTSCLCGTGRRDPIHSGTGNPAIPGGRAKGAAA